MPKNIYNGSMITIQDPLNINNRYDYISFVIECAKQLYAANYFGDIEGQEKLDEVQCAKDAIRRAQILANELFVNEYLDDASHMQQKSPTQNTSAPSTNRETANTKISKFKQIIEESGVFKNKQENSTNN